MAAPARGTDVDVLIVGARVAGSILASMLGRDGWRVLVVDRATFPSPTLSTHYFRGAWCVAALDELGVLDDVLATGAPRLVREYNVDALTGESTIDPPQDPGDIGYSLSVRRETLDAMLVERARREPTVEIRERTSMRELIWEGERVVGARISDGDGMEQIRARVVVGADGRGSRVASQVEATTQEHEAASRAMYYRYARAMLGPEGQPDGPEFSLGDDDLLYVFPSDGDRSCVAVSLNLTDYGIVHTRAEAAFEERIDAHPFVRDRVRQASWDGRLWACGPREAKVRRPAGPGWALVGDASMYQDPWTGAGMDNASTHARFLAEAVGELLAGEADEPSAWHMYHERRDDHAVAGWRETCELGKDLNVLRAT